MRVSMIYNYLSACAGDCSHMFWSGEVADSYPPVMLTVALVGIFSSKTIAPFCHFHLFVSVNVSKSRQHPRAKSSSTAIRIRRQYTIQYVTQGFLASNCIHLLWGKVYMTGNLCMQVVRKKNRRAARLLWYFSQRSPVFGHTQGVANIQSSHTGTFPLAPGKAVLQPALFFFLSSMHSTFSSGTPPTSTTQSKISSLLSPCTTISSPPLAVLVTLLPVATVPSVSR